ncbi:biotin-(acetyl-CoA-carboxylase) ligase [Sulfurihydrogenibium azorense Az-Fu1]|uniref:Bifunctional ligase/repressor BirA n=1 Tax=Sulfurihydrogenibium azorense (strain DSM 15241 / OCM 825 / Az-Fu1) TaxID=204536 RepID=C1DUR5_SULAA|nr:biotin--[acetyl-CoA-carboxylase] ligase [Sulfurihydrogenibium azorense]ACN98237.1 biotin-(acetyl-CoA-carboxylase) ligase [Sulfurihydrogenibium azorense Az-Fu1]
MIDEVKLINLLKSKKMSGEEIAKQFGTSRVAVWKKINKLKSLGYEILTDKDGYQIIKSPDKPLPAEILPDLNTKFLGKNYIYFEEVNSTNLYAKSKDFPDGTVIFAEYQTQGKGRKGRSWISSKYKGLYFSIVLKPDIEVVNLSKFSLLFPYSVFKTLKSFTTTDLKIKWPNDLYLNSKKLAGFLMESSIENNIITKLIVGIGINVNQDIQDFPDDINQVATSLKLEEGKEFSRKEIFLKILSNIEKDYLNFLKDKYLDIKNIEKNLLWLGENVSIYEDGEVIASGILKGLNGDGSLILSHNGTEEIIYVGDLSLRG